MARNITRTDFGPPPVRKAPVAPLCGHINITTGECCNRFGNFGWGKSWDEADMAHYRLWLDESAAKAKVRAEKRTGKAKNAKR